MSYYYPFRYPNTLPNVFGIPVLLTFLDVLILVGRLELEVVTERAEGVDEVGAEVGVDVGGLEFCQPLSVHRPVGVVTHHTLPGPLQCGVCKQMARG